MRVANLRRVGLVATAWFLGACADPTVVPVVDTEPIIPMIDEDLDGIGVDEDCDDDDGAVQYDEPFEGTLSSPEEIEGFCDGYCRRNIRGDLRLSQGAIVTGLDCVRRVTGDLVVQGEVSDVLGLTSIEFVGGDLRLEYLRQLENVGAIQVTDVGGSVVIANNLSLVNAPIFRRISAVGGDLIVRDNPNLETMVGRRLGSVGGAVVVEDNLRLVNVTALHGVATVGGGVRVANNPTLQLDAFRETTSIEGPIELDGVVLPIAFDQLTAASSLSYDAGVGPKLLEGFGRLSEIAGTFHLNAGVDGALLVQGLRNLRRVGGDFIFEDRSAIDPHNLFGLFSLQSIGGSMIVSSEGLLSLDGLLSLESVGQDIRIVGNPRLGAFDLLPRMAEVSGSVVIADNALLSRISGLGQVKTVGGDLRITTNPQLSDLSGLRSVEVVEGDVSVSSNWRALESVDPLGNLYSIGGNFDLSFNYALLDVTPLHDLLLVSGNVCVYANTALPDGAAEELVAEIGDVRGAVDLTRELGLCDEP